MSYEDEWDDEEEIGVIIVGHVGDMTGRNRAIADLAGKKDVTLGEIITVASEKKSGGNVGPVIKPIVE